MTDTINLYGDSLIRTSGKHGGDISSQRMDDLDIATLQYALLLQAGRRVAIDLGCGLGIQGLRLASLGVETLLIDRLPIEMTVLKTDGLGNLLPLSYLKVDAKTLVDDNLPREIAICYSQRFIHYLKYGEAIGLLKTIRRKMPVGAKLFLSASGLLSELGDNYAGKAVDVHARFTPLDSAMAKKHNIHEPVCLYTANELSCLCERASFTVDRVYSSAFGNIKGIFSAT